MKRTSSFLRAMRWLSIRGIEMLFVFVGVFGIFGVPEENHPHYGWALFVSKVIGFAAFYVWYHIDKAAFPEDWAEDKKLDEA